MQQPCMATWNWSSKKYGISLVNQSAIQDVVRTGRPVGGIVMSLVAPGIPIWSCASLANNAREDHSSDLKAQRQQVAV